MKPVIGESGGVEDVHHLRLMTMLHELVWEKGKQGCGDGLGIYLKAVASCMKTGGCSWRVREALKQGLGFRVGSVAARQPRRNEALERCLGH